LDINVATLGASNPGIRKRPKIASYKALAKVRSAG